MADGSLGAGEEVVKDGYFVTEEHEPVDEMGSHKPSTASDQDSFSQRWSEELDWRETRKGGIRD